LSFVRNGVAGITESDWPVFLQRMAELLPQAYRILRHIPRGERDEAFWLVSRKQSRLHEEKTAADRTLDPLRDPALPHALGKVNRPVTIGEAAAMTGGEHLNEEDVYKGVPRL